MGAIFGPKLGSIVDTEMGVQLGLLVSLGEEHEYRPGLELHRIFKSGLREGLERGLIVSRRAIRTIGIYSRQTILQSLDRREISLEGQKISLEKDDTGTSSLGRQT